MAQIVLCRLQRLEVLQSVLEALELDDCILVFRGCPTRLFQCFGDLPYEVCRMAFSQSIVSSIVARLGSLTDPADEIPHGEAKGRCHVRADLSKPVPLVDIFVDMCAQIEPCGSAASTVILSSILCSLAVLVAQWGGLCSPMPCIVY